MSQLQNNSPAARPANPRANRHSVEEDGAWARLYKEVGQPATAEEVIKHLDQDPEAKHAHLALYLSSKRTLRRQKAIDARNQRIGAFMRSLVIGAIAGPTHVLRLLFSSSANIAVEMLPPTRREPARTRVPALKNDPDFAKSPAPLATNVTMPAPAAVQPDESRNSKAA